MTPPTAASSYAPVAARERVFLAFETSSAHMHVGAALVFEPPCDGLDLGRLRAHVAARLPRLPRFRERLAPVPLLGLPVWVDDACFALDAHVRGARLAVPADDAALRTLAGAFFSTPLDRGRPLWELCLVEGLDDGGGALLLKVHHAIANGTSAVDLVAALLDEEAGAAPAEPAAWAARPAPPAPALLAAEAARLAALPLGLVRRALRARQRAGGTGLGLLLGATAALFRSPPATPLNGRLGPHRGLEWFALDLASVRATARRLGGTLNDLVLAAVAGAVGTFCAAHGTAREGLVLRALVPVSHRLRGESERASVWTMALPADERDPRRRLARVCGETARLKAARPERGIDGLLAAVELGGPLLFTLGVRLAARLAPYNLLVTNVPGPVAPLHLLGARLRAGYPVVPLLERQGVAVAVASYTDRLLVALVVDRDQVPDAAVLAGALREAFAELDAAAPGSA